MKGTYMASATRQANFTLPEDLLDELKRTVPKGKQSKVVSDALRHELKRIRFKKALQGSFGAWKKRAHPELTKDTRGFVRSLRKSTRLSSVGIR
jgi:metal-responsive CopG/Arc/MetJ family transcriptional regulator